MNCHIIITSSPSLDLSQRKEEKDERNTYNASRLKVAIVSLDNGKKYLASSLLLKRIQINLLQLNMYRGIKFNKNSRTNSKQRMPPIGRRRVSLLPYPKFGKPSQ